MTDWTELRVDYRHHGRDHPIVLRPHRGVVRVLAGRTPLAETEAALELSEAGYAPVLYVPRGALPHGALAPGDKRTVCPFKGDATHWTLHSADGTVLENAAWSYESPRPELAVIRGYLGFYRERVTVSAEADPETA